MDPRFSAVHSLLKTDGRRRATIAAHCRLPYMVPLSGGRNRPLVGRHDVREAVRPEIPDGLFRGPICGAGDGHRWRHRAFSDLALMRRLGAGRPQQGDRMRRTIATPAPRHRPPRSASSMLCTDAKPSSDTDACHASAAGQRRPSSVARPNKRPTTTITASRPLTRANATISFAVRPVPRAGDSSVRETAPGSSRRSASSRRVSASLMRPSGQSRASAGQSGSSPIDASAARARRNPPAAGCRDRPATDPRTRCPDRNPARRASSPSARAATGCSARRSAPRAARTASNDR